MNSKAIGVFDSGVGGLSCVKALLTCLPGEDIKYLGDTLRMPYGGRTVDQLNMFANHNVAFLQRRNVKLIAAACGTISSNVPKEKIDGLAVPFVDVIAPTVNAALNASGSKRIGIIATAATIKANVMGKRIKELCENAEVIGVACPYFVPLIESGHIDDDTIRSTAAEYLKEIKEFGVDTLILGCTHYPIISKVIGEYMGENVALIDSGRETALEIERALKAKGLERDRAEGGKAEYFVTHNTDAFDKVAKIFMGKNSNVKSVLKDIED